MAIMVLVSVGITRMVGRQVAAHDATDADDAAQPIIRNDHVALPDVPAEPPDINGATASIPFLCLDERPA